MSGSSKTTTTTTTTAATDSSDSTTDSSVDTAAILADLELMVKELRQAIASGKPTIQTIGRMRSLDRAISAVSTETSAKAVRLTIELSELALEVLPEDTMSVLESVGCGSESALELVRRGLTQLPTLAKTLYNATDEELSSDEGLRLLHLELSSSINLYGALVNKGVNPRKRPWALTLTQKFSSLAEMRRISWARLERLVGVAQKDEPRKEAEEDAAMDEDHHDEVHEGPMLSNGVAADGQAGEGSGKAPKREKVPTPAAPPAIRAHKLLPRGEFMVLQELFCGGEDTAPIRKQALDFGLGLYAADQLEQASITTAKELTDSNIRSFETKLVVPGMTPDEIGSVLHAMMSNRVSAASAPAPPAEQDADDDDDPFFGSYDTNEELVAAAGGGMALYGINFFPNEVDVTLKPYAPLLSKPNYVEMAGASASFEASVLHSTELSMASSYTKTTENGGISVAQSSTTSWGVGASVSGFGGAVSADASVDSEDAVEECSEMKSSNAFSANHKKTTTTATMVESIMCPMKSFRIPVSKMKMSEEALDSALEVDTLLKASTFLDTFGSHVSNGRHLLGGIFFRTITMTSETEVDTSTLLAAASTQMQQARNESLETNVSAGGGTIGVSAKASASLGSASSSGVVNFHSSAGQEETATADSRAMYQTYVRSMGPTAASPELFAEALFTDASSWTVIDRGPFEALVPITEVMENMLTCFDEDSPGKAKLEAAIKLVTVAWQQRASVWKPLAKDPAVPPSLRGMISRSFATQDAHDQIRAAVVNLLEVMKVDPAVDVNEAANAIGAFVLSTAEEMKDRPPGEADFFEALQRHIDSSTDLGVGVSFGLGTAKWDTAARNAKKLSSTDWCGFDNVWASRQGTLAIKAALQKFLRLKDATLRYGEKVTIDSPITSVNGNFRLELFENTLRVARTKDQSAVDVIFECDGILGKKTSAHFDLDGSFVLDHAVITGFNHTVSKIILWQAPNTEGNKGSYGRIRNDGVFVVFNRYGKQVWASNS